MIRSLSRRLRVIAEGDGGAATLPTASSHSSAAHPHHVPTVGPADFACSQVESNYELPSPLFLSGARKENHQRQALNPLTSSCAQLRSHHHVHVRSPTNGCGCTTGSR